jgi:hypothetical protein
MSVFKCLDIPWPPTRRSLDRCARRLLREPRDELTDFKWYLIKRLHLNLKKGIDNH